MGTKNRYTTPIVRSTASSDTDTESDSTDETPLVKSDDADDVHHVVPRRWARAYQGVGGNVQFVEDPSEWVACAPGDLVEVRA